MTLELGRLTQQPAPVLLGGREVVDHLDFRALLFPIILWKFSVSLLNLQHRILQLDFIVFLLLPGNVRDITLKSKLFFLLLATFFVALFAEVVEE